MKGWWQKVRQLASTGKSVDDAPAVFSGPAVHLEAASTVAPDSRPLRPGVLFSPDSLRRAWLSIKQAGGGAGVDGVTIAHFEQSLESHLAELGEELRGGHYRPRPLRQVLVPKDKGGLRPLVLWALRDRIAQRAIYDLLAPRFEPHFLPCSFGFRRGRAVEDAIQQVTVHRNANLRWVVDADIKQCFDSIDSDLLMRLVKRQIKEPLLLRYVSGWLGADILNSADGLPRKAGASQGNVLSPLLANIYLHEFDRQLTQHKLALVRYADDFVICCRCKEEAQMALQHARQSLNQLKLEIHPQKTTIVHFDQGFGWLGYFFIRNECYRL